SDALSSGIDPFASGVDPFASSTDPIPSGADPFASSTDPFASGVDPFASTQSSPRKQSHPSIGGVQAMASQGAESTADFPQPNDPLRPIDLTGVLLGNLQIERKLGQGGMGEVWRGRNVDLDVPIAIKVLPPELAADPQ